MRIYFNDPLISGTTYIIQFWAKSDGMVRRYSSRCKTGKLMAVRKVTIRSRSAHRGYSMSNEYTCSKNDVNRILLNFGKNAANHYIDNIKFGVKKATTSAKSNSTNAPYKQSDLHLQNCC